MTRRFGRFLRRNTIAMLALFLALGGTTYAASTALIGKNTVASPQVVNGSLQTKDLSTKARKALKGNRGPRGFTGAQGAQGAQGAKGATGAQGSTGPPGLSALASLPSGQTERGTVGHQTAFNNGAGEETGANAQLPIPAPAGLDDAHVNVATGDDDIGNCSGTAQNPTAPPGYVCIYPYSTFNVGFMAGYIWGAGDGEKWGFQLSFESAGAGIDYVFGTWAYTAP